MKIISYVSRKLWLGVLSIIIILLIIIASYFVILLNDRFIMGSVISTTCNNDTFNNTPILKTDIDAYFRPSNTPSINTRNIEIPYFDGLNTNLPELILEKKLLSLPEDTILNYYSILREAANSILTKGAGCGSIGVGKTAYPTAYNFFTSEYMKKVGYNQYVNSFKNILHINLLKLKEVQNPSSDTRKFFIELETIEGTSDKNGAFKYYYGYIYIKNVDNIFKISDVNLFTEIYLCAPYHGWNFMGENVVDIEYGNWCNMVLERLPTIYNGYIKQIHFKSNDGNEYMVEFITLTNDVDLKIADYIKDKNGKWIYISFNPEICLDEKK